MSRIGPVPAGIPKNSFLESEKKHHFTGSYKPQLGPWCIMAYLTPFCDIYTWYVFFYYYIYCFIFNCCFVFYEVISCIFVFKYVAFVYIVFVYIILIGVALLEL